MSSIYVIPELLHEWKQELERLESETYATQNTYLDGCRDAKMSLLYELIKLSTVIEKHQTNN